jgi:bla regulator protein blaR1
MSAWFSTAALVQTLVTSGLLIGVVLAARGLVARAFGARVAYALWLLPLLRLLLPPLPGWRTLATPILMIKRHEGSFGLAGPEEAMELAKSATPPPAIWHFESIAAPLPAPPPAVPLDWTMVAITVWLVGAGLFFLLQIWRYRRFLGEALTGARLLARECGIDILTCPTLDSPVAAGLFRRRILLPADFTRRFSAEERSLALRHEAAHHDRLDIFADFAALLVVALHWWNPLAHIAYRAFRVDQEMACDATVLADAGAGDAQAYGRAMLKSASGRMPAMACALSHKDQLKKRIRMMAKGRIGVARMACGAALVTSAIGGGLLLTASGQAHVAPPEPAPIVAPAPPPVAPVAAPIAPAPPVGPAAHRPAKAPRVASPDADAARADAEEAWEEAAAARAEAASAAVRARAAADQARAAGDRARRAVGAMPDVQAMVDRSMAQARAGMAQACAKRGAPMPEDSDFGQLATCGKHVDAMVLASLRTARAGLDRDHAMDRAMHEQAVQALDRSIRDAERRMADE